MAAQQLPRAGKNLVESSSFSIYYYNYYTINRNDKKCLKKSMQRQFMKCYVFVVMAKVHLSVLSHVRKPVGVCM